MSSQLLEELPRKLDLPIDYPSQKLLGRVYPIAVVIIATAATLYGYFTESVMNILIAGLIGLGLLLMCVLPPYPFYNKHKLHWVEPKVNFQVE